MPSTPLTSLTNWPATLNYSTTVAPGSGPRGGCRQKHCWRLTSTPVGAGGAAPTSTLVLGGNFLSCSRTRMASELGHPRPITTATARGIRTVLIPDVTISLQPPKGYALGRWSPARLLDGNDERQLAQPDGSPTAGLGGLRRGYFLKEFILRTLRRNQDQITAGNFRVGLVGCCVRLSRGCSVVVVHGEKQSSLSCLTFAGPGSRGGSV